MLAGCCFRMAQLLRLNSEQTTGGASKIDETVHATPRECRRRLMWSCYILDVMVGSGVETIMMSYNDPPKIRLPCHNANFVNQMLNETSNWLSAEGSPTISMGLGNLGLEAAIVCITLLRSKVLRYLRQFLSSLLQTKHLTTCTD